MLSHSGTSPDGGSPPTILAAGRRDNNPRYRQILCYRPTEKERYARDLLLTSCARGPGDVSGDGQRSGRPGFGVRIVADVGYRAGAGSRVGVAPGDGPTWRGAGRHRGRIPAAHA